MKKIIIATTLVLITSTLSSQVKENNTPKVAIAPEHFSTDGKELASGD